MTNEYNLGETQDLQKAQKASPAAAKYVIVGFIVFLVYLAFWGEFFSRSPRQIAEAKPAPLNLTPDESFPLPTPIAEKPTPRPKPQAASQPVARPQPQRQVRQKQEESMETKMRRAKRLLASYSPSIVPGVGTDGRKYAAQMAKNGARQQDIDMPEIDAEHPQMREIPSVMRANNRQGSQANNNGADIWTKDFYERGQGQPGVIQRAQSPFIIQRGRNIPVRLDTPINTDVPGQIVATVVRDVKDSATGRHTLIPAGSQIVGGYDTRIGYGQERLPTAWDLLIFPNQDTMNLSAMPGADRHGVAGLPIEIDNHLWRTAGRSLLLTVTGAAADMAISNSVGGGGDLTTSDALAMNAGQEINRRSRQVWDRGGYQRPTGTAASGDIFFVQVTQALEFPHPYRDEVLYAQDDWTD